MCARRIETRNGWMFIFRGGRRGGVRWTWPDGPPSFGSGSRPTDLQVWQAHSGGQSETTAPVRGSQMGGQRDSADGAIVRLWRVCVCVFVWRDPSKKKGTQAAVGRGRLTYVSSWLSLHRSTGVLASSVSAGSPRLANGSRKEGKKHTEPTRTTSCCDPQPAMPSNRSRRW